MKVYSDNVHIMMSKKALTAQDLDMLKNSLKKLKASGEYQKILDKYLK